ncbi:MAG: 2-amino-4-hydroxy-6-hydroxymethyldihydropteridine diphosphokinase [Bacteroidetes bacterium RIFOXYA12_FULL_35_11]|nr:MAG: 2-amino-4-hydroxy-6-hydroxymethyldihydropteridine diphosphokinase [Bacteroidetes bacterium GWF2_35_48]OFY82945.1 MAG: 2-amino-4-hydroxy-6-hydroxymethyldihydropteridine diphosphokinase [Bacteroidetes bacterium RIFOXYA12_FULL_35_11]OFY95281.1 MAG: 2-amino-4-hydroxy-6-hydroxymethyldihydropteridine diphosphokinase [Bacteroidetes bacterium RIFOXYB2_FULL_35_7]OFZ01897.1 MAG: 2-amino-4-hydroxy-6-hydroxymethyldihydropteridine diphosphokinase [Bacteroidetes bacterium RIFOXYC12_FULL_35_7]HBX52746
MVQVFLLLGSNIGDRKKTLETACNAINTEAGEILKMSAIYETEPWGYQSELKYLNQVIQINTNLSPIELLQKIHKIEEDMGRIRKAGAYSDRTIDIDILFYDDIIISDKELQIPHPRLHERKFTLIPLYEIAPDFIHPVFKKRIEELILVCKDKSFIKKTFKTN